ncbi:MAG: YlbF family regulator [Clostridia bacterium]|nr:YlbF family regulator [Clostridia bacterium]
MDMVFEKTRELGEALKQSEAYARMQAAEAKAMQNMEAAEMMAQYLEKRGQIQEMMEVENPDPAVMQRLSNEMDEIQEKLQMIDDIVELTTARGEFNALIGQINQVLQFIVTGRMTDEEGGCSGSCSSCSGCH